MVEFVCRIGLDIEFIKPEKESSPLYCLKANMTFIHASVAYTKYVFCYYAMQCSIAILAQQ